MCEETQVWIGAVSLFDHSERDTKRTLVRQRKRGVHQTLSIVVGAEGQSHEVRPLSIVKWVVFIKKSFPKVVIGSPKSATYSMKNMFQPSQLFRK